MTHADDRRRALLGWSVSAAAVVVWAGVVARGAHWSRVLDNWEAAITMLFGSFLSGASPSGGGAVAFPVFTKGLHVPPAAARSFGLSIQAVGMTMAVLAIVLNRRPVVVRATLAASVGAVTGFAATVAALGDGDDPYRPLAVSPAWTKAVFTVVFATTAVAMVQRLRRAGPMAPAGWDGRTTAAAVVVGVVGGGLAALTGTGANIVVFLFLVVILDRDPKAALPSAIVVMAAVSVVGLAVLGVADGHLDVTVVDGSVVSVGSVEPMPPLVAAEADLFGLWLAAVPVVVWGAPLGSWFASVVTERRLVWLVAALAVTEVLTTLVLVDDLRTDPVLVGFVLVGVVAGPTALHVLRRHRGVLAPEPAHGPDGTP